MEAPGLELSYDAIQLESLWPTPSNGEHGDPGEGMWAAYDLRVLISTRQTPGPFSNNTPEGREPKPEPLKRLPRYRVYRQTPKGRYPGGSANFSAACRSRKMRRHSPLSSVHRTSAA